MTRCVLVLALLCSTALAKPAPSGPLKAYKGEEGEVIVTVPVNDNKEMLVFFRGVSGLEGKSLLYQWEDKGDDKQEVFIMKKRGSKSYRSYMLTEYEHGTWLFINPIKTSSSFRVYYSETESKTIKVDAVVDAYKP